MPEEEKPPAAFFKGPGWGLPVAEKALRFFKGVRGFRGLKAFWVEGLGGWGLKGLRD